MRLLRHQLSRFCVIEKDYGKQNESSNNDWYDRESVLNRESGNHKP